MTDLVACLSTGKGTWIPVIKLINNENWDNIFLISTEFARDNFKTEKKVEFIVIDPEKPTKELVEDIKNSLNKKSLLTEVALNMHSGTGKEHMAILSALLKLGVGIRLVLPGQNSVEEL